MSERIYSSPVPVNVLSDDTDGWIEIHKLTYENIDNYLKEIHAKSKNVGYN